MKIEIIFVFLLISSIYSTPAFTASNYGTGTCTSGTYTFTVTGSLSEETTSDIAISATFSSPSTPPTATCSLPQTATANIGSVAITCSITSALNSNTITISAMTGSGVTVDVTGLSSKSLSDVTCPESAPPVTFTASSIPAGTCGDDGVYTFKVSGTLSAATSTAITLTPAFTSPATAPTVTCSLPATASGNIASAAVECKVTSALNSDTITVSGMTGTGITLSGFPKSMSGTATCSGKTNDAGQGGSGGSGGNGGSGDDAKFIQLSKFLMIILFFIF
jgi:hypothetical protein